MDLKIVGERKNPLLKRTEYAFEVAHPTAATPTRDQVRTELAKAVHVPKERVVVERMRARFGTATTVGSGAAYQTKEAVLATARAHILVRNGLKEKEAPATPGAAASEPTKPEAPKAEAPAPAATEAKPTVAPKGEPEPKAEPGAEAPAAKPKGHAKAAKAPKSEPPAAPS